MLGAISKTQKETRSSVRKATIFYKLCGDQWCKSLLSIGEDNLQCYPNFALFSTLGGMNLDQDFFQVSKLSEDQKRRSSPEMEHFFKY